MYKKVISIVSLAFLLVGCQHTGQQNQQSPPTPNVTVDFELPADAKSPPEIVNNSPSNAKIKEGETIAFNFTNLRGSVLLIIQGKKSTNSNGDTIYLPETPFEPIYPSKDGAFTIRLTKGNSSRLTIAKNTKGTYKYTIVDVSGNPRLSIRPPLDPYIIVGK